MKKEIISILIVDDEEDLLEMYIDFFTIVGFNVLSASSGPEALEIYKNNLDIRIIISDSRMGTMSGLQFLKTLKATYNTIPIFYLATGSVEETEEHIKSIGGHRLVLKPFELDEILIKIKKDLKL